MKDIEKYSLLIIDTLKEVFVLVLALFILLNHIIELKNHEPRESCESRINAEKDAPAATVAPAAETRKELRTKDGKDSLSDDVTEKVIDMIGGLLKYMQKSAGKFDNGITEYYTAIGSCIVPTILDVLSASVSGNSVSVLYLVYIICLYTFVAQIKKPRKHKTLSFDSIWNDFISKTLFVVLLPVVLMICISVVIITYMVGVMAYTYEKSNLKKWSVFVGFVVGFALLIWLFINSVSNRTMTIKDVLKNVGPGWKWTLIGLFSLLLSAVVIWIILLTVAGMYKNIGFILKATFMLQINKILSFLMCESVDMKRIFSAMKILVAIFILYNIQQLFPFIYVVFGVVVFTIMVFIIIKQLHAPIEINCTNEL